MQGTDERGTIGTGTEEQKFSSEVPEIPESIIGQLPDKAFEELYWKAQREELEGGEFQKELALLQQQYGGENAGEAENIDRDIIVGKSLGAKAKNYPVKMPGSRQYVKLSEGQTIKGVVFAGKGTNSEIRDRFRLESDYHIPASEWKKVSGNGSVVINGKDVKVELHWYEANGKRYEIRIKRYLKNES